MDNINGTISVSSYSFRRLLVSIGKELVTLTNTRKSTHLCTFYRDKIPIVKKHVYFSVKNTVL